MIVENEWLKLSERYKNIQLHECVVMPNHFHCIIENGGAKTVGADLCVCPNNDNNPNNENGQSRRISPMGETPILTGNHAGFPLWVKHRY
ncbi:MAG TPA: hypothetical protein PKX92_01110 [Edaphocola sp.]|nr:hypothetical protein [Edaphocola sp.]